MTIPVDTRSMNLRCRIGQVRTIPVDLSGGIVGGDGFAIGAEFRTRRRRRRRDRDAVDGESLVARLASAVQR